MISSRGEKGLDCLIKAAQFIEGPWFPSPGVTGAAGLNPGRKRCGRKRAGKISRSQHNQLEKDRRATLRSHLASLAQELQLDEKRATTLSVLEAATDEIESLQKAECAFMKQVTTLSERQERLLTKLHRLQRYDVTQTDHSSHVVPPSPPNSEYSLREGVRQRELMTIEPVSSAADTPESSPVSVRESLFPVMTSLGNMITGSDDACKRNPCVFSAQMAWTHQVKA